MILYMYITPGQGQKTPWGQTFDVNRKPLLLTSTICCKFQINLIEFRFYTHFFIFLMFFHMYIAPAAKSRSGLNFVPRSYGFTTERDLIVNEIGLYFLLAQASGFHTICHYQVFWSHITMSSQFNPKRCHFSCVMLLHFYYLLF